MEIFLKYGIIFFSIVVFIVLALGVLAMARGDNFNKNWSQKIDENASIISGNSYFINCINFWTFKLLTLMKKFI